MKRIFLSGAHGSACSMIKSQLMGVYKLDPGKNTCHESRKTQYTQNQDYISFYHVYDLQQIQQQYNPDITIWLKVADKNIQQIVQRIVVLDFMYTDDPYWVTNDHCWTNEKHLRIAGSDWPSYSNNINDYPEWCLNELCQVAYNRILPWTQNNSKFDFELSTDELFSFINPAQLQYTLSQLGCKLNHEFLYEWRIKNFLLWQEHKHRFSWTPDKQYLFND